MIQCMDALKGMQSLVDESIDLIITSPPYNMQNSTGGGNRWRGGTWEKNSLVGGYEDHDDNMPIDAYNQWQHQCLLEMYRLIKPTGAIFYNHKWRIQAGLLDMRQAIIGDLPVRQVIIWHTGAGVNWNTTHFTPNYEVIYMIPKSAFRLKKGHGLFDLWAISPEQNSSHPAPFPLEIPQRIIGAAALADTVLDPFCGSGTTLVAAHAAGKQYIGFDISQVYIDYAKARLVDTPIIQALEQKTIFGD